jgi:hypothetical protein
MGGIDTGLDLESFLLLMRADLGAWALLALGTLVLGLVAWLSFRSRRALLKCLAISVVAHAGLALYGSTVPSFFRVLSASARDPAAERHIRQIRVLPTPVGPAPPIAGREDPASAPRAGTRKDQDRSGPSPDLSTEPIRLADARLSPIRSHGSLDPGPPALVTAVPSPHVPLEFASVVPSVDLPPTGTTPGTRPPENRLANLPPPPGTGGVSASEISQLVPEVEKLKEDRPQTSSGTVALALAAMPVADLRREPTRPGGSAVPQPGPGTAGPLRPIPITRATPAGSRPGQSAQALADLSGPSSGHGLTEVPRFYRSRLDANRSARAQRSGASAASEQAVERALDWLARHQDSDGRWDGGTARYEDGTAVKADDDFTVHCPPGQTCFGECAYWEADTALTGLALLTYFGAGYTHKDGRYATTIAGGIDFLLAQQKADGDLRGSSKAVGMYCHAMATLALCEAYALSLDDRIRDPAERAVGWLVRARAGDGQAWRYLPGAPVGDTSILGWVVMALKSAREVGLIVPDQTGLNRGTLAWLDRVAAGQAKGLARYQPGEPVTATMTAEAWVCRQFLGKGGPGASSTEASAYLLEHPSDRGDSNFYYWYYGTLAMYQHGGPSWTRWNDRTRDKIVKLQRSTGHPSGSWDPDDSMYGARGGRIYCTTLAALTLEVYYRYLRLYDEPNLPAEANADAETGAGPEAPLERR